MEEDFGKVILPPLPVEVVGNTVLVVPGAEVDVVSKVIVTGGVVVVV